MSITAKSMGSRPPLSCCPSLEYWHRYYPCPVSGSGQRLAHKWIPWALKACRHFGMTAQEAHEWTAQRMSRLPDSNRVIPDWIEIVYDESCDDWKSAKGKNEPEAKYDPDKLERRANRIDVDITREWLAARSPAPDTLAPEQFLRALYREREHIWIGKTLNARRGEIWTNDADMLSLDHLRTGHIGVWFLANPVDGRTAFTGSKTEYYPNGETWRSQENVTSWRYLLLESDHAPECLWLRMLVQLQLPIIAIYTSGGNSVHALARVDQPSKEAWDQYCDLIGPESIRLGACPGSLTGVRLTRLPGCIRGETGQEQKLLYLNPAAQTGTSIFGATKEKG
jgi:hypothetical protein